MVNNDPYYGLLFLTNLVLSAGSLLAIIGDLGCGAPESHPATAEAPLGYQAL